MDAIKAQGNFRLSLTINGKPWSGELAVEETLLEFLRLRLRLTGTKRSCESEVCGACTVLVNNRPVSSCNYLAFEADGQSALTIEGLADGDDLDPLQEAFVRNIGAQCGYCTPGQIMAAKALLMEIPTPRETKLPNGWREIFAVAAPIAPLPTRSSRRPRNIKSERASR